MSLTNVQKLIRTNKNIKFISSSGNTRITAQIGVNQVLFKLTVVKKRFGLPTMKKHCINVIPLSDAIEICVIEFSVISKSSISKN